MEDKITETVRAQYEEFPFPDFHYRLKTISSIKFIQVPQRIFKKCLNLPLSSLKGKKLLDAGCGTGEYSAFYAAHGADVLAIDLSSASLSKAKALAKKFSLNMEFRQMNLLKPSLPQNYFEFVFSLGVLHHTANPRKAFSNISKALKPGGIIVLGLYPFTGRLWHRLKLLLLDFLAGKDKKKRLEISKTLFAQKFENISWRIDQYAHSHESYHTIGEILSWFRENNISYLGSFPNFELNKYPLFKSFPIKLPNFVERKIVQFLWLLKGHSFFFVAGRKN